MKKVFSIIIFALLPLLIVSDAASAGKINVVVSIYPLRDIVKQIGGDKLNVDFIVPAGASPHTFEPVPSDMIKISRARVLVIIGAGFEFWADKAIRSAGRKDLKVIVLSKGMALIHDEYSEGGAKSHRHEVADPHIWLDPLLTIEMVNKIKSVLVEMDGKNRAYYEERAEAFKRDLNALHLRIVESVRHFRTREYVTFHPAWNYFSKRYGLKVIGVIEESPGKEASPRHIARIVEYIRKSGAGVVFAEPQFSPKTARVIAKEAGAKVLFLDPLGGPDIRGRETYISLMEYNLMTLEEAMR